MCSMWLATVFGESTRMAAMSLFVRPRAARRRTSISRAVRPDGVAVEASFLHLPSQLRGRIDRSKGVAVRSRLADRLVHIGRGKETCRRRQGRCGQPAGIARSVQPLPDLPGDRAQEAERGGL